VPSLWFLPELVECSGRVLARSGNGDLFFVGRSLDSMYDLLSGALVGVEGAPAVHRVPLSLSRPNARRRGRRRSPRPLTVGEHARFRAFMAEAGITPFRLARRQRPATFVDVVHTGDTLGELYELLRRWIAEERETWPVIRRKLRFVGVTERERPSPGVYRWRTVQAWTHDLPAPAITGVSVRAAVWRYLADDQEKLTGSYRPDTWLNDRGGPEHDDDTRAALAEAVAIVAYGRSEQGRRALARAIAGEPALAESWLRTLLGRLNSPA
jgi:hypothetical protein